MNKVIATKGQRAGNLERFSPTAHLAHAIAAHPTHIQSKGKSQIHTAELFDYMHIFE